MLTRATTLSATLSVASEGELGRPVSFRRCDVEQSIISRFQIVALSRSPFVAVSSRKGQVTYDALNRAADSVARSLLRLYGTIAEPVGLLLGQDDRTISALMGVLKAGKFYVPLDPSYPADRLSFILEDCASRIIVTDREHLSLARSLAPSACSVKDIDDFARDSGAANSGLTVSPDAVAALFYTSGSTGRPKGVIQTHRLVMHRAMIDTNDLDIRPQDRLSLLTSPSYSSSLRHLFGALLNGAVVCPFDLAAEGLDELAGWLQRERISIYASVPSVYRQLIGSVDDRWLLDTIRIVHLGGETVTSADFDLYRRHFSPGCRFVTTLSSNETGQVRRYSADKTTRMAHGTVPVGYAVDDKDVIVVDENDRPLASGEVGEIVVKSEFLSPGYWGRPDLTAAVFEADPNDSRTRIYRTGDLGMMSADGCLIFKGRRDARIKIRGIRVEIEEIDAALQSHPAVDRAVVTSREDVPGQHVLIAYLVLKGGVRVSVTDIRRFLAAKIPDCMVPSAFVFLERLPLTPHGKIDKLALPVPDVGRPPIAGEYIGPVDEVQRQLTALCESVIGIHPIGIHDNLFDLGIDSLTLLQLASRIARTFGRHLPPATLFQSPTIERLATILGAEPVSRTWSSLVPIQTTGTKPPFFWVHGDSSAVFLSRALGPDQPFYALEHQGQDGTPARHTGVDRIAAYYVNEVRTVRPSGPYFLGGYSFGGVVALEMAQQLTRHGERVALLALLDPPSLAAYQPESESRDHNTISFADWFHDRIEHLSTLTVRDQINHVTSRGMERATEKLRLASVDKLVKRMIYRAALSRGVPLPVFVRRAYIHDIYASAGRRYVPEQYTQPALLLKGQYRRYGSEGDWEQLLTGRCHVEVVRAEHLQMRDEQYVHLWADMLLNALSNAQAAER